MSVKKHISTAMAVAMVATSVAPVMAATTNNETIIGSNRHDTAVKISKEGWSSAETVILVNSSAIPDALTATPLAHAKNAPILLTGKDGLNKATADEIKRLGAKNVIMIGGDAVLPAKIENALKALKVKVDRIKGATREETALAIAKRLDGIKDISEIAVVNGTTGLADAVSVAAAAAERNMPIILANPKKGLSVAEKFIKGESIKASFIIGGKTVLPEKLVSSLPGKQRIEGSNRNNTNAKVIEKFYADRNLDNLYLAKDGMGDSGQLIDALAVGALAAKNGAPVLIASKKLSETQKNIINTKRIDTITQVGGKGNEKAFAELKEIEKEVVIKVKTEAELQEALKKANANDVIEIEGNISKDIILSTNNAVQINVRGELKGEVTVKTPNADIKNSGTIGTLVVENAKNTTIKNTSAGKISKVEIESSSSNVKLENDGKITNVENNANGTEIENYGTISNPVTGTVKPEVDGNKPGGGSNKPIWPSVDQDKVNIVNKAKEAVEYKYTGTSEYTYTGEIRVTGTESADVEIAGPYDSINLGGDNKKAAMDDMARYLGALYRNDEKHLIKAIKYNGNVYEWSDKLNLQGSRWTKDVNSDVAQGNTLVSNIVSDSKGDNPINKVGEAIELTLVGENNKEVSMKLNFAKEYKVGKKDGTYITLSEAVSKIADSDYKKGTIKLMENAEGPGIPLYNDLYGKKHVDVDLTIDLGNYTYNMTAPNVGSPGTESQAFHLEKNNRVTIKNGTIKADDSTGMLIQNYCDLTLENLNLVGGKLTEYIISCNNGNTSIKNVNISGSYEKGDLVGIDAMHWPNNTYPVAPVVTVNNTNSNKIDGRIDSYCSAGEQNDYHKDGVAKSKIILNGGKYTGKLNGVSSYKHLGNIEITSGIFNQNVSDYCVNGHTCTQSGSNWIVK